LSPVALVDMVAVNTMKMSVVDIVNVIAVLDGLTPASLAVLVVMVVVDVTCIADRIFPFCARLCHK